MGASIISVCLEPANITDAPSLAALVGAEAGVPSAGLPRPPGPGAAEDWLRRSLEPAAAGDSRLFIVRNSGAETVGTVRLAIFRSDRNRGQLSYWIAPAFRRRGYATAAVSAVCDFGFEIVGLDVIEAYTRQDNTESARVLRRNSFIFRHLIPGLLAAGMPIVAGSGETLRFWEKSLS